MANPRGILGSGGPRVYDCPYLGLAIELDASLATADLPLARAAHSHVDRVDLIC
jgi:predicted nucleic acid-binding protein